MEGTHKGHQVKVIELVAHSSKQKFGLNIPTQCFQLWVAVMLIRLHSALIWVFLPLCCEIISLMFAFQQLNQTLKRLQGSNRKGNKWILFRIYMKLQWFSCLVLVIQFCLIVSNFFSPRFLFSFLLRSPESTCSLGYLVGGKFRAGSRKSYMSSSTGQVE